MSKPILPSRRTGRASGDITKDRCRRVIKTKNTNDSAIEDHHHCLHYAYFHSRSTLKGYCCSCFFWFDNVPSGLVRNNTDRRDRYDKIMKYLNYHDQDKDTFIDKLEEALIKKIREEI